MRSKIFFNLCDSSIDMSLFLECFDPLNELLSSFEVWMPQENDQKTLNNKISTSREAKESEKFLKNNNIARHSQ